MERDDLDGATRAADIAQRNPGSMLSFGVAGLAVNVIANFLLVPRLGVVGLALGGAIGAWANCGLLYAILVRRGFSSVRRIPQIA